MSRTKFDSLQMGEVAVQTTHITDNSVTSAKLGDGARIGIDIQPYSAVIDNLDNLNTVGIVVKDGNNFSTTQINVSTGLSVSNSNGITGNPTLSLSTLTDSGTGSFLKILRDSYGRVGGTQAVNSTDVISALEFTPENTANKGQPNGYAPLDQNKLIPSVYFPSIVLTNTFVVNSEGAMLALSSNTGDIAIRTDLNKSFILKGEDPSLLNDWQELLTQLDSVSSVNGYTGSVSLTTSDVSENTNLYFTSARSRNSLSVSGSNLNYNSETGVFSLSSNLSGITVTSSEINYLSGVSSNVQTQLDSKLGIDTGTLLGSSLTTTTTSANQVVETINASTYRGAEFLIQATSGTDYQLTKLLALHDDTVVYITEYGTIVSSTSLATFDVDILGGNLRLLVTPANANTSIKTITTIINI